MGIHPKKLLVCVAAARLMKGLQRLYFVSASHSRPKLQRAKSAVKADPETALLAYVGEMRPGSAHFKNRHRWLSHRVRPCDPDTRHGKKSDFRSSSG
jgi:hypothetical protein